MNALFSRSDDPDRSLRFSHVNLDDWAAEFQRRGTIRRADRSVLLNPNVCQKFVSDVHAELGVTASYGGWLENRRTLWKGSYMEEKNLYIHVGVDFNVPWGTRVLAPFDGEVLRVDDDSPEQHGWGPRLFLRPHDPNIVLIFAHLSGIKAEAGERISAGMELASVGPSVANGGWYPHLHAQAMTAHAYEEHIQTNFKELDGYTSKARLKGDLRRFRDPLPILFPFC